MARSGAARASSSGIAAIKLLRLSASRAAGRACRTVPRRSGRCDPIRAIRQPQKLPPEGLGENGLVEFRQETRCMGVLGGDAVEPRKSGFDEAHYFLLLRKWRYGQANTPKRIQIYIFLSRCRCECGKFRTR